MMHMASRAAWLKSTANSSSHTLLGKSSRICILLFSLCDDEQKLSAKSDRTKEKKSADHK